MLREVIDSKKNCNSLCSPLHPQKELRQYLTHRHVGGRAGSLGTVRAGAPRISPATEDLSIHLENLSESI